MKVKQAIIPTAGWGTRRLPVTKVIEKSMLPIGNRPLVDYVVQDLAGAGIEDIYIVVSAGSRQIQDYYGRNEPLEKHLIAQGKEDRIAALNTVPEGVRLHFIEQPDDGRYGTAVPVAIVVEEAQLEGPTFVFMGDDFLWNKEGVSEAARMPSVMLADNDSVILGQRMAAEDIAGKKGWIVEEDGRLKDFIEKPELAEMGGAKTGLANISKYIMSVELLHRVAKYVKEFDVSENSRGEYEITDPVYEHVRAGGVIRTLGAKAEYLDGGTVEGWLHANETVLKS
ncbi:sugar phosphate nucleotidyltransferase [Candidatus Saccharibacteria bacterium]|nr:sugar phosphate nucleotidyltransferase [Candidatus Saccharibacteria bacterium]